MKKLAILKKPHYVDEFRFGIRRSGKVRITADTDTTIFKSNFFEDSQNGFWQGWIFAISLSDLSYNSLMESYYLSLSKDNLIYLSNFNGK